MKTKTSNYPHRKFYKNSWSLWKSWDDGTGIWDASTKLLFMRETFFFAVLLFRVTVSSSFFLSNRRNEIEQC